MEDLNKKAHSRCALPASTDHTDLDARLKAKGMISVTELMAGTPMDKWISHAAVNDLESYEKWLVMRREEMLKMKAYHDLDGKTEDDLYEWILSHVAVFSEAHINFRKAINKNNPSVNLEKMREKFIIFLKTHDEFEEWMLETHEDGLYIHLPAAAHWETWRASRQEEYN